MAETAKQLSGNENPSEADLDYLSRPENYTGSNLQTMQLFFLAQKEDTNKIQEKKKTIKDAKYHFFHRYKHILKEIIFIDDLMEPEEESDEDDGEEEEGKKERETMESREEATPTTLNTPKQFLKNIPEEEEYHETAEKKAGEDTKGTESSSVSPDRAYSPEKGQMVAGVGMESESDMSAKSGGGTRQTMALMKAKINSVAKDVQRKQLRLKFKKYARMILVVVRLMSASNKEPGADMGGFRTFMDIASEGEKTMEKMKNQGLSFDPSYYKAKKEISLSTEVKNALQMPPEKRTPEMVQTVMFGLQCLKSFAEYPLHMQEKLAKVAWYEIVPPKKIIIRQGQSAENFYFILTGHAVVTILIRDPKTGQSFNKTATVMKKGMSFGELALLHHSKRTATVTSQDTVQLLSIGREDFFDIFMSGQGPDNMPEHIRFISQLDFMKDWPIQRLLENSDKCLLHFFKRNTVIVKDSNFSDWVYVVKTGSCQVLKQLKGVTATLKYKPKADSGKIAELCNMALVFQPKIDTGLRRKKKKHKCKDEKKEEKTEISSSTAAGDKKTFAKEGYVQKPEKRNAQHQVSSAFAKRKRYKPPRRCMPRKPQPPPKVIVPKKPVAVFVQVTNLKRRDAFGLDTIVFQDDIIRPQTSVSLVSQGAECVMLSKAFYVKHANELVKKRIRYNIRPFPDEETFQENLQIKEDWILYKKCLLEDLTSHL